MEQNTEINILSQGELTLESNNKNVFWKMTACSINGAQQTGYDMK